MNGCRQLVICFHKIISKNKKYKEKMKRAQVQDAIGWMLVAADRYPGLSVRTRNG